MKVFIAGAREIRSLNSAVIDKLNNIIKNEYDILVGDASGVDKNIQIYLKNKDYKKVTVYSMQKVRNNIGEWENIKITSKASINTREYFTEKDKRMAEIADIGLMIWNKKSEGTLNNMINLLTMNKKVCLFIQTEEKLYHLKKIDDLEKIIFSQVSKELQEKYSTLLKRAQKNYFKNFNVEVEKAIQLTL
ncbi:MULTISPECIES: hypothetical protein [Fusobacterium]|jgi:cell fate (sporulation/competence/biofilm development) regulator YlbF (YheA/YmcA/DUF963 family)|uniref:hypothetical protein n=1 Tax=Fusobacterium TaxID=848 RepID=UPI000E89256D|nr:MULTISPECIES: hypothetical protein [Fusobacterium]HBJ80226.1 hypothetical protein [Fusobacterium sp.]